MQTFYVLCYKTKQLQRSFSGHFESLSSDWLTGNTHTDKCEHFIFSLSINLSFPVTHDDASIHPFCSIGAFLQNCWSGLVPYISTSVPRIKKNEKLQGQFWISQKNHETSCSNQKQKLFYIFWLVTMLSESNFTLKS